MFFSNSTTLLPNQKSSNNKRQGKESVLKILFHTSRLIIYSLNSYYVIIIYSTFNIQMEDNNKVILRTNYFKFNCGTPILKYKVDTNPTIPSTQVGLLFKLLSKLRTSLFEKLGTYQPSNFMIYSPTQTDEAVFHVEYENTNYEVKILPCGILDISRLTVPWTVDCVT